MSRNLERGSIGEIMVIGGGREMDVSLLSSFRLMSTRYVR